MLREEQIDIRKQRGKLGRFQIENLSKKKIFSDYKVTNPTSGGQYQVTIRGFETGDNQCTCPDYKANTLGTCKHIEAVLESLKDGLPAHVQRKKATITRPEIFLYYGEALQLGLHLPTHFSDQLGRFAQRFFDEKFLWSSRGDYRELIPAIENVPEEITVMSDALDFIDRELDRQEMASKEEIWLQQLDQKTLAIPSLAASLYEYQSRGAIFLACRGRAILGDDMGLGKTLQTLAAVELLAEHRGIQKVLVIAPSSVKYQWQSEIRKFTQRDVQVIDGDPEQRLSMYEQSTFYRLVNYEQVVRDREAMNAWKPDLIVLDEAQRIKNWQSKTSQEVKKLVSKYAIVLSGTPLENKLEELHSIVQFVDERRFGPAFQFLHDHRVLDDEGHLIGYRNLDRIREKLAPIFLRRTRAEVLKQLPIRTDQTIYVELSDAQRSPYEEQRGHLARLMQKSYLSELDRRRILASISNLRLICDSTFLFDKETKHSPKLDEFADLVPEILSDAAHKIVVFSQWETMIQLAAETLEKQDIGYTILHGGMSGKERQATLERFQTDPECRVFLSTDAGGTGLNLQIADTVMNLELPWNPAVLEQRIARVHRLGQERPVQVIHLVTRDTIEERVQKTLAQKSDLFQGLFESDSDDVQFQSIAASQFQNLLQNLVGDESASRFVKPSESATRQERTKDDESVSEYPLNINSNSIPMQLLVLSIQLMEQQWNQSIDNETKHQLRIQIDKLQTLIES